jgi:ABC-type sugar transport system ATPase subunit
VPGPEPAQPVLALRGLTKAYGGVTVLRDVDLDVAAGEVHALLGENGAGKSTLIKILSGVVAPDAGSVEIAGVPAGHLTPHRAAELGVATLHQELAVVPGLSVAENVLLGRRPPQRLGRIRWRALEARAREILDGLGQHLDVRQDAARLSPVGMTMVAIARAVSQDAKVLVLDEPTASLTDRETAALFAVVRRLAARGVAVLYVSHRLEEVLELCDTWTVLRGGVLVGRGPVAGTQVRTLIDTMAGRPVETLYPPRDGAPGAVVLEGRGLVGRRIRDLDVDVRAGEVLGVAGLAGSGRSELLRLLAGVQAPDAGSVQLAGPQGPSPLPTTPAAAQRAGVVLVPQERRADALVPDTVERNVNLATLRRHTRARVLVNRGAARSHARAATQELGVRHRSLDQPVLQLSGGNQQKVVLARFLALQPRVLLLDEPTRGVDVATKAEIYRLVRERTARGLAVVVAGSDLLELQGLADRVLVLHEGVSQGSYDAATTTEARLLHACYGKDAQA